MSDKVHFQKACGCCRINSICKVQKLDPNKRMEPAIFLKGSFLLFFIPAVIFLASLYLFRRFDEFHSFLLALPVIGIYYIIIKRV